MATAAVGLWFATSAVLSTYSNSHFLARFGNDALALTLVRFAGSAALGLVAAVGGANPTPASRLLRVGPAFVVPALCLLGANLANSVALGAVGITLTYVTKAGIPLVTVLLCLLRGQTISARLALTLVPTVIGVALSAWADVNFNLPGFVAACVSTISQAALNVSSKSAMSSAGLSGPQSQFVLVSLATFFLALGQILGNLGWALSVPEDGGQHHDHAAERWVALWTQVRSSNQDLGLLVLVCVAYHLEYVLNFIVTDSVGEVTFAVLDVARRLAIIVAGAVMFDKTLTPLNMFGVVLALGGVFWHSRVKRGENNLNQELELELELELDGKKRKQL